MVSIFGEVRGVIVFLALDFQNVAIGDEALIIGQTEVA